MKNLQRTSVAAVLGAAVLTLALAGCVSTSPKTAFDDVQKTVADRTGESVQWPRDDSSTNEIARAVHQLLATNLTAHSAVAIALLNNRSLQAEFEEIGISQADYAQASRLQNIAVAGSWRIPNRPPSAVDAEYAAAFNLLDLLTLPARKRIAAQNLAQTKLRAADAVLRLAEETQKTFYALQAQSELVKRLAVMEAVNDAAADVAQRQYDAGNIPELELRNLQAPALQSRLDLLRAKTDAKMQRERLNRLLGLAGENAGWQVAAELPAIPAADPPLDDLEALAVSQRLDLAADRGEVNAVAAALRLKNKTRYLPGASVGVDSERMPDRQIITGPTLEVELPLFDQGQPALARLTALYRQSKDNYTAKEVNIRAEVREAWNTLSDAREAVKLSQEQLLPLRKKILGETLLHYNAMQKNAYDLLMAKENEQAAEQRNIEASRDYWIARVSLERAVGGRLITGVGGQTAQSAPEPLASNPQP